MTQPGLPFAELLLAAAHLVLAASAVIHALLHKSDPRGAFGWVGVCILFPLAGPLLYYLFGINRVQTRARRLLGEESPALTTPEQQPDAMATHAATAAQILHAAARVTGRPLLPGNQLTVLINGEQAYPAMLDAIAGARHSIDLASYIFDNDQTGKSFVAALAQAQARGVAVRVLVDGLGERYSLRPIGHLLRRAAIPYARFLPPRLLPPSLHINLRNHRKAMVIDDRVAFTGGMNIGDRHLVEQSPRHNPVRDLHFRVAGPVVGQIAQVFAEDWRYASGDSSEQRRTTAAPTFDATPGQGAHCRVVTDGPNEDLDKLLMILTGAVAAAQHRVTVMTPYFLPPRILGGAMQAAALRGVEVNVILPGHSNLPFVDWASRKILQPYLRWGVKIWLQPPPFVHTKLFLVDDEYALIGSANLDARSLRLNFELCLEIYDQRTCGLLVEHAQTALAASKPLTQEDLVQRPMPVQLRDAFCWLFSPYL